jgi:hypothetical protein
MLLSPVGNGLVVRVSSLIKEIRDLTANVLLARYALAGLRFACSSVIGLQSSWNINLHVSDQNDALFCAKYKPPSKSCRQMRQKHR